MSVDRLILVNRIYTDDYKLRLWRAVIEDLSRHKSGRKDRISPERYYLTEVKPTVEQWIGSLRYERPDAIVKSLRWPVVDELEGGPMRRLFRATPDGSLPVKPMQDHEAQIFDAYMKIKHPAIAATFAGSRTTELSGEVMADFLRDKTLFNQSYDIESIYRNIVGLYEYEQADMLGRQTGLKRFLAVFSTQTRSFLLVMDFFWDVEQTVVRLGDEELDLHFGFMIPGRKLSPVILRSLTFRERQAGLIYSERHLYEFENFPPDELVLDIMTTESEVTGQNSIHEARSHLSSGEPSALSDWLVKAAQAKMMGPRVRQTLKNANKTKYYDAVMKRISKIKKDYL